MSATENTTSTESITSSVLINDAGICNCCSSTAYEQEIIQCAIRKNRFHALCKSSTEKICLKTLLDPFMRKNTSNNFIWLCDPCLVKFEVDQVRNEHRRIDTLEEKYNKIEQQLDNIQVMLSKTSASGESSLHGTTEAATTSTTVGESSLLHTQQAKQPHSPWFNKNRVEIMKDSLGNNPDIISLESSVLDKSINPGISKTTKDGRTVILCNSIEDANALHVKAAAIFPGHKVVVKKPRKSIIRVVGLQSQLSAESFTDQLFVRNPSFETYNTTEDYEFSIVKPCLKNPSRFQAVIKVSEAFRSHMKKYDDRILISLFVCRVYDQVDVKRCNKCHKYGHWVKECDQPAACSICADAHETKSCTHYKDDSFENYKCINCTRNGLEPNNHCADSPKCPIYIKELASCKARLLNGLN